MAPNSPDEKRDRNTHSARDVSQGEIILRTPLRKAVFLGALVLMVLLIVILGIMAVAF
ncbi:hypothetical protein [Saliniramus sp.]|uniref:hypothetical protein n=1 Tax=Saliniramus sp. TaxID=2986772 RepID=UPI002C1BC5B2|nr:hypothetical protein [Saliniramus sp.]HMB09377.1 hypothetical protein [Saliniramus sp.]